MLDVSPLSDLMDAGLYRDLQISAYLEFSALTLLCYDHIVTLSMEVPRLWRRPLSRPSLLFFGIRYTPLALNIASTVLGYAPLPAVLVLVRLSSFALQFTLMLRAERHSCPTFALFIRLKLLITQLYICILMALRIMAMYSNKRCISVTVSGAFLVLSAASIVVLAFGANKNVYIYAGGNVRRCQAGMTDTRKHVVLCPRTITGMTVRLFLKGGAFAWVAQTMFDAFIVVLTVFRTFTSRREDGRTTFYTWSLGDIMFRDGVYSRYFGVFGIVILHSPGAMYFVVISLANLANILTFYMARCSQAPPARLSLYARQFVRIHPGSISSAPTAILRQRSIATIMISRLILNLHEAAARTARASHVMQMVSFIESSECIEVVSDRRAYFDRLVHADLDDETAMVLEEVRGGVPRQQPPVAA
ncbi:hypothetical protein K488DRAFT_88282 [Vararia minispora EC-137]|uniref:Uncharacterized protein n=1 Tax=Vararia minispora EC-137 TaxID=1314806 RepID=A0ACB8QE29_9AGAM|nr:hypothetical protein K488DRAFT_88282 [Vararia minispora EC-137]